MPRSSVTKKDFGAEWWRMYGGPVAGKDCPPEDPYWNKLGLSVLDIKSEEAQGMLLAMVFDENRTRARQGLDKLRRRYKAALPELSRLWGRPAAGRKGSFSEEACVDIALARDFGYRPLEILRRIGRIDCEFNSSYDTSKFNTLNKAVAKGRKFVGYEIKRTELKALSDPLRRKKIERQLKRHISPAGAS